MREATAAGQRGPAGLRRRAALELFAQTDAAAADGTQLVRTMLMLAYGFARRGQPFVAATWLWRTVKCRRGVFAQVCTFLLRRLARGCAGLSAARGIML
jgi:hypothetical protein